MPGELAVLGFIIGVTAGLYYFFGLWLTVRKAPASSHPRRLLVISYLVRLVPTLAVMFFTVRHDPGMFLTLLLGFFLVRFILTRKIAAIQKDTINAAQS